MEFVEIIIIYIYLDYFSYSIYQDENLKSQKNKAENKKLKAICNNIYGNKEVKDIASKLTSSEYQEYSECMKYNFNFDLKYSFPQFKEFINSGVFPLLPDDENKDKKNKI